MSVVIDCNIPPAEATNTNKKQNKTLLYICLFIFSIILIASPISEIIIGVMYKDQLACDTELFINLDVWLITKGCVECFVILCLPLLLFSKNINILKCMIVIIVYLFNIFTVIWIISGSIIFFKDCSKKVPGNLYPYFIFILTFGYIGFINFYAQRNVLSFS